MTLRPPSVRLAAGIALATIGAAATHVAFAQQPVPTAPVVPPVKAAAPKPKVKLPANVVARVGSQDITREDALAMFNTVAGRPIVDQLVQATVVEQEAAKNGVTVSNAELQAAIKQTKERIVQQSFQSGHPMEFADIAEQEGFSDALITWSVRQDLLRKKTFAKSLEKSGAIASRDNQVKLSHILFMTMPPPSPDGQVATPDPVAQEKRKAEQKAKAEQLLADINAKKISWDEAAKQSDDKSNADKGGQLDFYNERDLDPSFAKAGWAIQKPGDIVGPVESRFGWHLIKLDQKGRDLPAAEKAAFRQQQLDRATSDAQATREWMANLQKGRTITFNRKAQIVPGAKLTIGGMAPKTVPVVKKAAPRQAASLK